MRRLEIVGGIKACTKCGTTKPLAEFYHKPSRAAGVTSACRECIQSARRAKFPSHEAYLAHYKDVAAKSKYGVTAEDFNSMLDEQAGGCAICGNPETMLGPSGKPKRLSIDHSHVTNEVRGLLCMTHNRGLGFFGDDPEMLRRAAAYLERKNQKAVSNG